MVHGYMEEIRCAIYTVFHSLTHFEKIDEETMYYLLNANFPEEEIEKQLSMPGSKFYASFAQSPWDVIDRVKAECSEILEDVPEPDEKFRVRLSFVFDYEIGTDGVVSIDSLTPEELSSMRTEVRNGRMIRKVKVTRVIPTKECQIVFEQSMDGKTYFVVTLYPGVKAPPLPEDGESDPFWDNHCFVEY